MTTLICSRRSRLWLAVLALLVFTLPAAAQVRTLGLQEMVNSAGMIFSGRVTEVRGGRDAHGDIVTYTTFAVEQGVRGVSGSWVTIKQYGGESDGLSTRLQHVRYFQQGEKVMVMLYPASELGFTSPIGLSQGVWQMTPAGMVLGVTSKSLSGIESLLRKHQVAVNAQTIAMSAATFTALVRDIAQGGAK